MANKFPYYPVFVYGTLMSGFSNHKKICENVLVDIQYGEFRGGFLCYFIDDNPKEGFERGYVDILEARSKCQIVKGELLYFKKDNSYDTIKKILDSDIEPLFGENWDFEAQENLANIEKAKNIGWNPTTDLSTGLKKSIDYIRNHVI